MQQTPDNPQKNGTAHSVFPYYAALGVAVFTAGLGWLAFVAGVPWPAVALSALAVGGVTIAALAADRRELDESTRKCQ
ncbi:MAG: hypothetical protein JF606_10300 [Burkholderiales bacterium]|jgi:CHASE2 domain-containing sensor protein|nr:hypothetical protein [Burkholderiales bacterium]